MLIDPSQAAQQAGHHDANLSTVGELLDIAAKPIPHDRFRDPARAIADLRRGAAVVIQARDACLALAVAETVDAIGLAALRDWSLGPLILVRPAGVGDSLGDPVFAAHRAARDTSVSAWRRLGALLEVASPPGPALPLPEGFDHCVTLAKLAGLAPALAVARVGDDGVARARRAGAIVVEADDIVALQAAGARLERVGEARIPLEDAAEGRLVAFRSPETGVQHLAVVIGSPEHVDRGDPAPLVRLHSECFTGDVLGSLRCDCGPQLRDALRRMATEGAGVVLYLEQEGRGIGLLNKLRSYALQDRGLDTLEANAALGYAADERDFAAAAAMLRALGVTRARLLTNNPDKLAALTAHGVQVERASLLIAANGVNDAYLATKAARLGHLSG